VYVTEYFTALYALAKRSGAEQSIHYFLVSKCQRRVSGIDTTLHRSSFVTVVGCSSRVTHLEVLCLLFYIIHSDILLIIIYYIIYSDVVALSHILTYQARKPFSLLLPISGKSQ